MRRPRVLLALALAGCAGSATRVQPAALGATQTQGWQMLELQFEPPLHSPGELFVAHETGLQLRLLTARTGVVLQLPAGPAFLRLCADGGEWSRPITVPAPSVVLWARKP